MKSPASIWSCAYARSADAKFHCVSGLDERASPVKLKLFGAFMLDDETILNCLDEQWRTVAQIRSRLRTRDSGVHLSLFCAASLRAEKLKEKQSLPLLRSG